MRYAPSIFGPDRWRRECRHVVVAAWIAAIAFQSLIPAGFMPGTLAAGESPVVVCPSGLNPAAFDQDNPSGGHSHPPHHHTGAMPDDDGSQGLSVDRELCAVGTAFDTTAAIAVAMPVLDTEIVGTVSRPFAIPLPGTPPVAAYRSRAPPAALRS